MNGDDFTPFLIRQRNNVGDVVFALSIIVGQLRQPAFHICAVGNQNAGVDLLNLTLLVGGIFVLNNAGNFAVFTGDTSITGRIIQFHRQQTNATLRFSITQTLECFDRDQRHVAVEH